MFGRWRLPFLVLWHLVEGGRIIQSDNRKTYQAYFSSVAEQISGVEYRSYNCFSKGWRKVALIKESCHNTDFVVWIDSDTTITLGANMTNLMEIASDYTKKHLLVAGIEESNTIKVIENLPSFITTFSEFINDGMFAVSCSPDGIRFLETWQLLTEHWQEQQGEVSDQKTLQLLANRLSIYSESIKFDTMAFGASSKFVKHFPGFYRSGMPRPSRKMYENLLECPIKQKSVKYGTTIIKKILYIVFLIVSICILLYLKANNFCMRKQKI